MKYFKFYLILSLSLTVKIYGQSTTTCKLDIDSLFQTHFFSLDTTVVCGSSKPILPSDFYFVLLASELSNINFQVNSYTRYPILTIEDVLHLKKWYWKNRYMINCKKVEELLFTFKKENEDAIREQLEYLKQKNQ